MAARDRTTIFAAVFLSLENRAYYLITNYFFRGGLSGLFQGPPRGRKSIFLDLNPLQKVRVLVTRTILSHNRPCQAPRLRLAYDLVSGELHF